MEPDDAEPASGPQQRLKTILQILRDGRMSVLDFLLQILHSDKADFVKHREQFFSNPSGKLTKLLDLIFRDKKGRMVLIPWMEQHATDLVIEKVVKEMDEVKKALVWTIKSTTPDDLLTWDIDGVIGPLVTKQAPTLGSILQAAAQTKRARDKNKIKTSTTACNVIVTQLAKERSQHALYFAIPFTLFFWTNGAPRQTIEALHKCGLGISFSSLAILLHQLAGESLQRAARVISGPHALCWDNINIKTSIFVEQRESAPGKVQSGTFAVIYEINTDPLDMRLPPLLARAKQATDLTFNDDVRPTSDQRKAFHSQIRVHIINILLEFSKSFEEFERPDDPRLVHSDRRKMPDGHCTKQYPLRTSTIDESSTSGNIAVINDVYINQLKVNPEDIFDRAVPSINDQSTNARIRAAKALRTKDTNPFTRIQFLQLGFGLFHLCMNLIWALLHVHRGSVHQVGSLSYFFAVLDRTRLGCEHPDYHTLLTTLFQILDGVILNAWKIECGYSSLAAFASSNPSADDLVRIADQIIQNHVSLPDQKPTKVTNTSDPDISHDTANQNLRLLTRDLLHVRELTTAISNGDFGRVEDILGPLTMIFRGAGSNNYASELLHWIYNVKKIWTPKFADIMRDTMLVNMTGLEHHWMPIDLNIEHQIRFLKTFFAAKGVYASWDRLGDISASVDLLQNVRKQVLRALKTSYHGITHIDPDTTAAVDKIAYKVRELELHHFKADRPENKGLRPTADARATGAQKLISSTLTTFNRKVKVMMDGGVFEAEEDEIPVINFAPLDETADSFDCTA